MKKIKKIKITVNGKIKLINEKTNLSHLINRLKIPIKKVAIELNQEIMNKKKYELIFNFKKKYDLIKLTDLNTGKTKILKFMKKRSTDFINELNHILDINNKLNYKNSFINIKYGLSVQNIINKIF